MSKIKSTILRGFLLLLALVTLLSVVGCQQPTDVPAETDPAATEPTAPGETDPEGPTETDPAETDPEETDPEEEGPGLPEVNYGNSEFDILIRGGINYDIYIDKITAASTSMDRAVYERMRNVSETYGVVFNLKTVDAITATVASNVKSGVDKFDLVADHGATVLSCVAANYMYDWSKLKYVDLDATWWNQSSHEAFTTPGGKTYAMHGDISHNALENAICLYFNRDMITDLDLVSPFQLVREDKWTLDVFEEYVLTLYSNMDGDGSGSLSTDSFGYGCDYWCGPDAVFFSTGLSVVEWKNDEWSFNLEKERAGNAMFDYRELLFSTGACYFSPNDRISKLAKAFLDNRLAFFDGVLMTAPTLAGTGMNFGLLPFPKYDRRGEYGTYISIGANAYAVMRNTSDENAERISVITEALAYEGYTTVIPLYYETVLSYQYLEDEESLEMLHIIHDTARVDFGYFYSQAARTFQNTVTNPTGTSLSQAFGEIEEAALLHLYETWNILDAEE